MDNSTTPSNVIDQMITLSITETTDIKKSEIKDKRLILTYNFLLRKRRIGIRNRLSKIDSVKRFAWNQTGPKTLERAERRVLETLKSPFEGRYIPILNKTQKIWTTYSNVTSENIPIVLIHGFGGGVGLWSLNLDELSENRPVYAIDLPGFGRSSRPLFSLDPDEAEKEFISMIEDWRKEIGLNRKFILLGHSFGGFISASYALHYPKFIQQLVLIDPWGFSQRPENIWETGRFQRIPVWLRTLSPIMMKISPLTGLRIAGPFGIPVIKRVRSDIRTKFEALFDDDRMLVYLYHCNAQLPTGEQAFRTMSDCFAWAKKPMIERIHLFDENIPIYFLQGKQSWITIESSLITRTKRSNIFIESIEQAGHHIYADTPQEFNTYLKRILLNRN